jgi:ABC-type transporter Mla subunit MlaD
LYDKRSELAAQADGLRRQLARYDSANLDRLSQHACEAVERAQSLFEQGGPGLTEALEAAAAAAQALREAVPAPAAAGQRR